MRTPPQRNPHNSQKCPQLQRKAKLSLTISQNAPWKNESQRKKKMQEWEKNFMIVARKTSRGCRKRSARENSCSAKEKSSRCVLPHLPKKIS